MSYTTATPMLSQCDTLAMPMGQLYWHDFPNGFRAVVFDEFDTEFYECWLAKKAPSNITDTRAAYAMAADTDLACHRMSALHQVNLWLTRAACLDSSGKAILPVGKDEEWWRR